MWLPRAMTLIMKWIASVWVWGPGVFSRTVGARPCLCIFLWLHHGACYGKHICLTLLHCLLKVLVWAVEMWGTWEKLHFLSLSSICLVQASFFFFFLFFPEEKEQKWQSTESSKCVVPLVNDSLFQDSKLFVCSCGFPGRRLLVAGLRKILKGQSRKGQRIYSSLNNALMSKYIWYVGSINF